MACVRTDSHFVKATMPLFTVLLSRIILFEKQTLRVYVSLLPIIGGVIIATMTELSFDMVGLISALIATLGFSLQNIFSKKCLQDTGIHHLRLLVILARIAGLCFLPLWFLYDFLRIWNDSGFFHSSHAPRLMALLLIDGFCSMTQNLIAFTVIAMVTPLSYAVANATKRVCIISVSLVFLGNPVSFLNVIGMMVAVMGVLLYNKEKYDQNKTMKATILPMHSTSAMLNGGPSLPPAPKSLLLNNSIEKTVPFSFSASPHTNGTLRNTATSMHGGRMLIDI